MVKAFCGSDINTERQVKKCVCFYLFILSNLYVNDQLQVQVSWTTILATCIWLENKNKNLPDSHETDEKDICVASIALSCSFGFWDKALFFRISNHVQAHVLSIIPSNTTEYRQTGHARCERGARLGSISTTSWWWYCMKLDPDLGGPCHVGFWV